MPFTTRAYTIGLNDSGRRADRILRNLYKDMPLSYIYRLFRDGGVRVSGRKADGSLRVEAGQTIEVRLPDTPDNAVPERGRIDAGRQGSGAARFADMLLVETPDIAIVNKPRGVLTHGAGGVDEAARAYYSGRMAESLSFTPAPLHRLDRNTSGALVVSASLKGAASFSAALRLGHIGKLYVALLGGELREEQAWIDALTRDGDAGISATTDDGERAEARAVPVAHADGLTLAVIRLGTGRTHQIRVQAASRGLPLAGDAKYGGQPMTGGYLLHCAALEIPRLDGAIGPMRAEAPLPATAIRRLSSIFGEAVLLSLRAALGSPS